MGFYEVTMSLGDDKGFHDYQIVNTLK